MKKVLLVSLMLAMIMALVLPTAVVAAKPATYNATGKFISIDEGKVKLLAYDPDNSANIVWQVKNRNIQGVFDTTNEDNSLQGPFTVTYDAIVDGYQAGDFTGSLKAKSVNLKIQGTSSGIGELTVYGVPITLSGTWTKDSKTQGTFEAQFCFVPTADHQHIDYLTISSFTLKQEP
jgi:hypothetical protein